jgi:hypothetical protein
MEKLRRIVPVLGILILAVAIYDGSIFYRRWAGNRQARQAQADRETDQAQKAIAMVGGGDLKIVSFYALPETIAPGGQTSVCYGVTGAKTVRLEPPIQAVWPALTRCFTASLRKDTELKLSAEDGAGHTVSQRFVVKVR